MSLYLGDNLVSGVLTPIEPTRNIGQIIPSTIPLSDAGLHLLDGTLLQYGSYKDFIDYIANIYDNYVDYYGWYDSTNSMSAITTSATPSIGDIIYTWDSSTQIYVDAGNRVDSVSSNTISSGSYTFIRNSTYDIASGIFCSESEWQTSVTNYATCDKYVYNSTNNTVRLPKKASNNRYCIYSATLLNGFLRVYSDGWCEQGGTLPTATSWANSTVYLNREFINEDYIVTMLVGAQYSTGNDDKSCINTKTTSSFNVTNFNNNGLGNWYACGYTSILNYEQKRVYEYVVIANSVKTEIEVDIDEIATDLNGKADVDGSNMVSSVKNFDGQWISSISTLSTATAVNSYEISLSNYLPNDNYNYEVLISAKANRSSSGTCVLDFGSDIINTNLDDNSMNLVGCSGGNMDGSASVIPVGLGRKILFKIGGNAASWTYINAIAYRRIGTNS